MIQIQIVAYITMALSLSILIFYFLFQNKINNFIYSLYLIILVISIITLTYTAIQFNINKDKSLYILFPLANWLVISFVSYEVLTKFYSKKFNDKLYRLITLVIIVCYLLLINLIKYIL